MPNAGAYRQLTSATTRAKHTHSISSLTPLRHGLLVLLYVQATCTVLACYFGLRFRLRCEYAKDSSCSASQWRAQWTTATELKGYAWPQHMRMHVLSESCTLQLHLNSLGSSNTWMGAPACNHTAGCTRACYGPAWRQTLSRHRSSSLPLAESKQAPSLLHENHDFKVGRERGLVSLVNWIYQPTLL